MISGSLRIFEGAFQELQGVYYNPLKSHVYLYIYIIYSYIIYSYIYIIFFTDTTYEKINLNSISPTHSRCRQQRFAICVPILGGCHQTIFRGTYGLESLFMGNNGYMMDVIHDLSSESYT
jgi:hypothetical protein